MLRIDRDEMEVKALDLPTGNQIEDSDNEIESANPHS
jgi:hypothetical protein